MQMDPDQAMPGGVRKNLWTQISLCLLTLGVVAISILILYPFLLAITGAVVLAVSTQRPYNWLTLRISNRNICAALALLLVILCIIIPGFFIAQDLVLRTGTFITFLRSDLPQRTVSGFLIRFQPSGVIFKPSPATLISWALSGP